MRAAWMAAPGPRFPPLCLRRARLQGARRSSAKGQFGILGVRLRATRDVPYYRLEPTQYANTSTHTDTHTRWLLAFSPPTSAVLASSLLLQQRHCARRGWVPRCVHEYGTSTAVLDRSVGTCTRVLVGHRVGRGAWRSLECTAPRSCALPQAARDRRAGAQLPDSSSERTAHTTRTTKL